MKTHVAQVCFSTHLLPEVVQPGRGSRTSPARGRKHPPAGSVHCVENLAGRRRQPHGSGARLAIAQEEMSLAIVGPPQRQDLTLAASGQEQKANDRYMLRTTLGVSTAAQPGPSRPWKKKRALMAFLKSL